MGKPIKVDERTLKFDRGRFARVCVEIDLNKLVVGKLCVMGTWHKVEYERLHVICSCCGCYGHVTQNCTMKPPTVVVQSDGGSPSTVAGKGAQVNGELNSRISTDMQGDKAGNNVFARVISNDKVEITAPT